MNKLVTIATVSISVFALAVSVWQGYASREHNRLSVRPYVQSTPYLEGPNKRNGIYISNYGLGPAILNKATINIDGTSHLLSKDIWEQAFKPIGIDDLCFSKSWIPRGSVIPINKEIHLIKLTSAESSRCLLEVAKFLSEHDLSLTLEYTSMYNEKITTKNSFNMKSFGRDLSRAIRSTGNN